MYERILVALDGSRFSEEVIPYAVALAARGAPLTLLRVVDKAADESDARAYVETLGVAHGERDVDGLLAGKTWLMGDDFTVADGYLFTVTNWAQPMQIDLSPYQNLTAYRQRVAARPAVQAAMKAEGLI